MVLVVRCWLLIVGIFLNHQKGNLLINITEFRLKLYGRNQNKKAALGGAAFSGKKDSVFKA